MMHSAGIGGNAPSVSHMKDTTRTSLTSAVAGRMLRARIDSNSKRVGQPEIVSVPSLYVTAAYDATHV